MLVNAGFFFEEADLLAYVTLSGASRLAAPSKRESERSGAGHLRGEIQAT